MSHSLVRKATVFATVIALSCALGSTAAPCADSAPKKEKGEALQQLETIAGKKIEDVKVPDVPKPTPAGKSFDVNTSTSSYEVTTSTAASQGVKP